MRYTTRTLTLAVLLAAALAPAADAQAKQAAPPAGTPKDLRLPPKQRFTLPNGMEVTMVPFGVVPKVTVRLTVRVGNANEGPTEVWLADITADMMEEGTRTRSGEVLAREFAGMGGALNVNVTPDQTNFVADVLAERGADAVRLIADVVRNPRFPASELERLKADRVRQLAIAKSSPQSLADEKFSQILYGDHPYGRIFPTEAMLQGYTLAQVRRFHADNFGAARARLYVAGVFDAPAMERAIRAAFGDWERGRAPVAVPEPKRPAKREVALLDRPDAPQSTLYLGLHVPDPSNKDWIPLEVTDYLLGGAFGSRVTTNIREAKGYTYSPYSTIRTHPRDAAWMQVADVTTNVTGPSLKEIFAEIDRLQKEAPPTDELRGIQNNLAGIFTVQNASRGGVIGRLAFVDLHGLGDDYLSSYVKNVMAVSPSEVRRIAAEYLKPDRMALVIVGDKKAIQEQVAPYMTVVP